MGRRMHKRLDRGKLERSEFRVEEWGMGDTRIVLACPCCSAESVLTGHVVAPDGTVTPQWSCPTDACPLMDYIHLEGIYE